MNLLTTLFQAAKQGLEAKAQQDAGRAAARAQAKSHGGCTPCAANAKVQAERAKVAAAMGKRR